MPVSFKLDFFSEPNQNIIRFRIIHYFCNMINSDNGDTPLDLEMPHVDLLWRELQDEMQGKFGKTPDLQTMLFLIGVQELAQVRDFNKEEKRDLMHLAICKLLSLVGYYEFLRKDEEGWGHYRLTKELPDDMKNLKAQEALLKRLVLQYFDKI